MRLKVDLVDEEPNPNNQITVEFINANEEESTSVVSVRYVVRGSDRDWVFVASSELEERLGKVRFFVANQLYNRRGMMVLTTTLLLLGLLSATTAQRWSGSDGPGNRLEAAWQSGRVKDPIEAIIFLEKARTERPLAKEVTPLAIILAPFMLLLFLLFFANYMFPPYNFCWGDYLRIYERRTAVRKYVLIVVLTGTAVSLVGGVLANMFGFRHGP